MSTAANLLKNCVKFIKEPKNISIYTSYFRVFEYLVSRNYNSLCVFFVVLNFKFRQGYCNINCVAILNFNVNSVETSKI